MKKQLTYFERGLAQLPLEGLIRIKEHIEGGGSVLLSGNVAVHNTDPDKCRY